VDPGPSLRDLACFAAVARQLNFSRAAGELGLSQPAVSQAIARVERILGVRLLDRTSREVSLSAAGHALLPRVVAALAAADAVTHEARRLAAPMRLAYCPLVGAFAARVVRRLAERKPAVTVELSPSGWRAAGGALTGGTAAAALMSAPFPAGMATTARFQVPITHLAVRVGAPLSTAARVSVPQLAGREVLVPRELAEPLRRRLGAGVRAVPARTEDLPAALDLVAAGRGVLPTPHLLVETVRRPDIRFVPLDLGDEAHLTYALAWHRDRATADTMALVQTVQEVLRVPARRPNR
jgi:DNA-binding transcriptional LysR family regulator